MMRVLVSIVAVFIVCFINFSSFAAIHRIVLDGAVDPIHAEYIVRGIDQAEREGSDLILLVINTPGGLGNAMETIITRMLKSKVPICTYVYPPGGKAASAGFFILISSDIAAMAPGTRTGAAHPILSIGGVLPLPEPEKGEERKKQTQTQESTILEKITNDMEAFLRAIADKRGRDKKAAELAVSESKSYADQEALQNRLIDFVVGSEKELITSLEGKEVTMVDGTKRLLSLKDKPIIDIPMTFRETVLASVTDPNVAFLLLLLGILLIYIEITHFGLIIPGVIGGICLLLAVTGFSFLPVSATGILFILAAFALFVAEIKVQGFGFLGIAGVICLALGGIMLVDVPEADFRIDPLLAIVAAITFGGIILFLAMIAVKASKRKPATGNQMLIGMTCEVVTDLAPRGKVLVMGEYWDAVSDVHVNAGSKVRCIGVEGLTLKVEPIKT